MYESKPASTFFQKRALHNSSALHLALVAVCSLLFSTIWSAPVRAAVALCDVPYLVSGSSSDVDGTTVAVTSANNTKNGGPIGFTNYYWHDVSTGGGASTTWTFDNPVTTLVTDIVANADAGVEKYSLEGFDSGGNSVLTYVAEDLDEMVTHTPSAALARLELTFTPLSGPYGSVIKLSLPRKGNLCTEPETVDAGVVAAADKEVTVGETFTADVVTLSDRCSQADRSIEISPDPRDGVGVMTVADGEMETSEWIPGDYQVVAIYGGDANCDAGRSSPASVVVHPAPTQLSVTATSPVQIGETVGIATTITSLGSCSTATELEITPDPFTGTGVSVVPTSDLSTTFWRAGEYSIRALFEGDVRCLPSESQPVQVTVLPLETSLNLVATTDMEVGTPFAYSVVLNSGYYCLSDPQISIVPSPISGTGSLEIPVGGTSDTSNWLPGTYEVRASFGGDARCLPSVATSSLTITAAPVDPPAQVLRTGTIRIFFDPLSARLTTQARAALRSIPAEATRIRVTGFVQGLRPRGNTASLSRARSSAVVRFLRSQGVAGEFEVRSGGVSNAPGKQGRVVVIRYWYYEPENR